MRLAQGPLTVNDSRVGCRNIIGLVKVGVLGSLQLRTLKEILVSLLGILIFRIILVFFPVPYCQVINTGAVLSVLQTVLAVGVVLSVQSLAVQRLQSNLRLCLLHLLVTDSLVNGFVRSGLSRQLIGLLRQLKDAVQLLVEEVTHFHRPVNEFRFILIRDTQISE